MKDLSLINSSKVTTMSSIEIAELTGKRHDNILVDIRKMLEDLNIMTPEFSNVYLNKQNKELPCFNLPEELFNLLLDRYKGLNRVPHRLREEAALKTIEQLLGITLIRQYKVLNYRIDGYHVETNTCYEIDEPEHYYKTEQDNIRQAKIEKLLNCKFVRIKL